MTHTRDNMLIAKPVVSDKFWIVENDGKKIATIQTTTGGVVLVRNEKREQFPSIKLLCNQYNISIDKTAPKKHNQPMMVDEYPCDSQPYNALYDVNKKLPVYTKEENSKCFYCAGHYLLKNHTVWIHAYCPKLLQLNRTKFIGPFKTKAEATAALKGMKK